MLPVERKSEMKRRRNFPLLPSLPSVGFIGHLFFRGKMLFCSHADLRISLRRLRAGQRNPRSLIELERRKMPALRLGKDFQEIFHVCRFRRERGFIRQQWWRSFLRRRLPLPLIF